MTIEEDDAAEIDADKSEWVSHEYTKNLLSQARAKEKQALEALVNACAASTDLRIVQFWAKLQHMKTLAEVLGGGKVGAK